MLQNAYRNAKRLIAVVLLVFIFCGTSFPAIAAKEYAVEKYSNAKPELMKLKEFLYTHGYYLSTVDVESLGDPTLDDQTMYAVKNCCDTNRNLEGLVYDEGGILQETWAKLDYYQNLIQNLSTPEPDASDAPVYSRIAYGGSGVWPIQKKLAELGYIKEGMQNDIYDQATIEALDDFFRYNPLAYDQREDNKGLTPEIQATILSRDDWNPMPTPEPEPTPEPSPTPAPLSGTEKARAWLTEDSDVFGLELPRFAAGLIAIVLIAAIIFALVYFFGSNGSQRKSGRNAFINEKELQFEITYHGHTEQYSRPIGNTIKIGRNVGSFPLNMDDRGISRKHCEIFYQGRELMLRDYSANGTIVDGKQISNTSCVLHKGSTIRISEHLIKIDY
ncbi:MAG: FHA domain-containing protein [Clostridia bacterium]|nr:FHA domain-containing protein [Clostridia bacterium]